MYDLLIANAIVVLSEGSFPGDIAIDGEKISAILNANSGAPAHRIIDAGGRKVLPGLLDAHMHVQAPFQGLTGQLTFFQQSVCAAFSGVTTFMDFTNTWHGKSVLKALHERKAEMAESAVDYGIHGKFVEADEQVLADIPGLVDAGCPTFKMFMTYRREGVMSADDVLVRIFGMANQYPILPMVHAESNSIAEYLFDQKVAAGKTGWTDFGEFKPKICETEAFERAVTLAMAIGSPLLVVHTTHGGCLDIAARAQRQGHPIYVETCPQYLTLFDDIYRNPELGHMAMCSPPLRTPADAADLWRGIQQRVISVTGSDDCTFTRAEKEQFLERDADGRLIQDFRKVVNGISGLETRLPVLLTEGVAAGRISLNELVAMTSTNVAKLMGCYPKKGTIAPGSDADLVMLDDEAEWTIGQDKLHNGADVCLLEGYRAKGKVHMTISRGQVIMADGEFLGERGRGKYLHRVIDGSILKKFSHPL